MEKESEKVGQVTRWSDVTVILQTKPYRLTFAMLKLTADPTKRLTLGSTYQEKSLMRW